MKLFMFYIGGSCGNSNVELHDVRFSIGETPEDCHEVLRRQWWGDPESLHLDCWGEVEQADGLDIALTKEAPRDDACRLFFVNVGGYHPAQFTELHKNILLVVPDARTAKAKAKARIQDWLQPHKNRLFEIEKTVDLSSVMQRYGYSLRLTRASNEKPFAFVCRYLSIA